MQLTPEERGGIILQANRITVPPLSIYLKPSSAPWERTSFITDTSLLAAYQGIRNSTVLRNLFQHRKANRYRIYKVLYTDGSKKEGRTGYSVVAENKVIRRRIPDIGTIFAAEGAAVREAMTMILEEPGAGAYLICTDSLSVVSSLKNLRITSKWKDDMLSLHNQCLRSNKEVVFLWLPSHVGIGGNEQAGREAKAALMQSIDNGIQPEYTQIKQEIKKRVNNVWNLKWLQNNECKLREVKNHVLPYTHLPKTRKENVILTRLRIGHTLATHKHLLERKEEPICERCNERLTVKHILCTCPALDDERNKVCLSTSLREVLADDVDHIRKLLQFIKNVGICNKI